MISSKVFKIGSAFLLTSLLVIGFQNCGESSFEAVQAQSKTNLGEGFAAPDADSDGLTDAQEIEFGTEINNKDTDGDGLEDGAEVNTYGTNPLDVDTDDGGVNDGVEVGRGSDPLKAEDDQGDNEPAKDNDGDGLSNDREAVLGTDPNNSDTDGDGVNDGAEVTTHGTNPLNPDTDGGGVTDGAELRRGSNPKDDASDDFPVPVENTDPDRDGLSNDKEAELGTDPYDADTDGDKLKDGDEVNTHGTDPLKRDTDDGGVEDGDEINAGSNPVNNPNDDAPIDPALDTDKDGLTDVVELDLGTDPAKPDTDMDGLLDGAEVNTHGTNPVDPDTDGGGALDGYEISVNTKPLDNPADDLKVTYLDLDFIKAPDLLSKDKDAEFVFDAPMAKDFITYTKCQLDSGEIKDCKMNEPVKFENLSVGTHTFRVYTFFKTGSKVERVYRWAVVKAEPDVFWSPWSPWYNTGGCVANIQKQVRTRSCIVHTSSAFQSSQIIYPNTESKCDGEPKEYKSINCSSPVHGGWGQWSAWSDYSDTVKKCGVRSRTRTCTNPIPVNGGRYCSGSNQQLDVKACPADLFCKPGLKVVCPMTNGVGQKICNSAGSAYGSCKALSCSAGYSISGGKCVKDLFCSPDSQIACSVSNGTGAKTCNAAGSAYGSCKAVSCATGYKLMGGKCVMEYTHIASTVPCSTIGLKPSTGAFGNCFSGEARVRPSSFPRIKDLSTIVYKYGTWGGYSSTGGTLLGKFCYRKGQKRDNDRTDIAVGYLCEPSKCPAGYEYKSGKCMKMEPVDSEIRIGRTSVRGSVRPSKSWSSQTPLTASQIRMLTDGVTNVKYTNALRYYEHNLAYITMKHKKAKVVKSFTMYPPSDVGHSAGWHWGVRSPNMVVYASDNGVDWVSLPVKVSGSRYSPIYMTFNAAGKAYRYTQVVINMVNSAYNYVSEIKLNANKPKMTVAPRVCTPGTRINCEIGYGGRDLYTGQKTCNSAGTGYGSCQSGGAFCADSRNYGQCENDDKGNLIGPSFHGGR